jgi:hypothetical protein
VIIFLSDLHLSDGTFDYHHPSDGRKDIAHDMSEEAFAVFWDDIYRIVAANKRPRVKHITVILLGDMFEMRSTTRWVASDYDDRGRRLGLRSRPWNEPRGRPSRTCLEIFESILEHNRGRLKYLSVKKLAGLGADSGLRKLVRRGVGIDFRYVAGNHDSLLIYHRSPVLRNRLRRELGWRITPPCGARFPAGTKFVDERIGLAAEHGHRGDKTDYFHDNFIDPPLGCVTADSLARLMFHLRAEGDAAGRGLSPSRRQRLVRIGMGLDDVRPSAHSFLWLISNLPGDPQTLRALRRALRTSVAEFLEDLEPVLDFIFSRTLTWLRRSRPVRTLAGWLLRRALRRLDRDETDDPLVAILGDMRRRMARLSRLTRLLSRKKDSHFHLNARREVQTSTAQFVLYGHSHRFETLPLMTVDGRKTLYFNTGTWKKTILKNLYDPSPRSGFQQLSRMDYIIFYDPREQGCKQHVFELWHGNLQFTADR